MDAGLSQCEVVNKNMFGCMFLTLRKEVSFGVMGLEAESHGT